MSIMDSHALAQALASLYSNSDRQQKEAASAYLEAFQKSVYRHKGSRLTFRWKHGK